MASGLEKLGVFFVGHGILGQPIILADRDTMNRLAMFIVRIAYLERTDRNAKEDDTGPAVDPFPLDFLAGGQLACSIEDLAREAGQFRVAAAEPLPANVQHFWKSECPQVPQEPDFAPLRHLGRSQLSDKGRGHQRFGFLQAAFDKCWLTFERFFLQQRCEERLAEARRGLG